MAPPTVRSGAWRCQASWELAHEEHTPGASPWAEHELVVAGQCAFRLRTRSHAFRCLTARHPTGRVASVFRHGFNILFDNETDPGFV